MMPPISQKEVHKFIDLLKYYRDMWSRRSHTLLQLTKLTSIKIQFKRDKIKEKGFEEINWIVVRNILSAYLDFNK